LVALGGKRPFAVLALCLALVAGATVYAATHFAMTTDTAALISPKIAWRQNEKAVETAFPQLSDVLLVIVDGKTPELAEAATAKLSAALAEDTLHFRTVQRPDGGAFFDREGLLFGSTASVKASTKALIDAQPLLGPLAGDPSLRGIAGAFSTMLTGVTNGDVPLSRIDRPMRTMAAALETLAAGKPAYFSWQQLFAEPGAGAAPPL
ncbi:MAG: hopanoid biosynthesis-associated RND transporter HpnN, partial [Sphingomonas sp.]|nr:hopanoid biosynthesis-associated RND transporter HpnN [Sphingomonas sp.]